jgi:hypothetical protein
MPTGGTESNYVPGSIREQLEPLAEDMTVWVALVWIIAVTESR